MSRGKLNPEDEKQIKKNFLFLKNELEASDLLDSLYQNEAITIEDKIRISKGKTKLERNDDLLLTILHSGPGTSFKFFLLSLQAKYPHVREKLETKDCISIEPAENNSGETHDLRNEVVALKVLLKEKKRDIKILKDKCEEKDMIIENLAAYQSEATTERDDDSDSDMSEDDEWGRLDEVQDDQSDLIYEVQVNNFDGRRIAQYNHGDILPDDVQKYLAIAMDTFEVFSTKEVVRLHGDTGPWPFEYIVRQRRDSH